VFPGLLLVLFALPGFADQDDDREAIRAEIEYLTETRSLSGRDIDIAAGSVIAEVYANRGFSPAWTEAAQIGELIVAIESTQAEGLNTADYYVDAVRAAYAEVRAGIEDPQDKASADILFTESLIRVGYHQLFGKVNPATLDSNWNFRRDLNGLDPATAVQALIDSPSLAERLTSLVTRGWVYNELKAGLAEFRAIQAAGGWVEVPDGPTLRIGATDDRLPLLANRLAVTGELESPGDFATYDENLAAAVRLFQQRHGLADDGILGPATLRALNVPVEQRIQSLELSLERARWVMNGLADDFILVNIAGFEAYLVRGREVAWRTRVQVGRPYRQSPVFRDEMKYLVFNPTWTVPYSIATRDILPQIQRDVSYLTDRGFQVKNRNGEVIDYTAVDWSQHSRANFPYTLVQGPGPANALGRVKFMFPNRHAVYLHDTPSKSLFASAERTFSSGCIRVENPFELAEELLGPEWNQDRIRRVLDSGEITTVSLPVRLPILLLYWTASVGEDGAIHFYNDVYGRDQAIADALDKPFDIDP
jgi:murein L,D-transpeptidase YcbB/YkuD